MLEESKESASATSSSSSSASSMLSVTELPSERKIPDDADSSSGVSSSTSEQISFAPKWLTLDQEFLLRIAEKKAITAEDIQQFLEQGGDIRTKLWKQDSTLFTHIRTDKTLLTEFMQAITKLKEPLKSQTLERMTGDFVRSEQTLAIFRDLMKYDDRSLMEQVVKCFKEYYNKKKLYKYESSLEGYKRLYDVGFTEALEQRKINILHPIIHLSEATTIPPTRKGIKPLDIRNPIDKEILDVLADFLTGSIDYLVRQGVITLETATRGRPPTFVIWFMEVGVDLRSRYSYCYSYDSERSIAEIISRAKLSPLLFRAIRTIPKGKEEQFFINNMAVCNQGELDLLEKKDEPAQSSRSHKNALEQPSLLSFAVIGRDFDLVKRICEHVSPLIKPSPEQISYALYPGNKPTKKIKKYLKTKISSPPADTQDKDKKENSSGKNKWGRLKDSLKIKPRENSQKQPSPGKSTELGSADTVHASEKADSKQPTGSSSRLSLRRAKSIFGKLRKSSPSDKDQEPPAAFSSIASYTEAQDLTSGGGRKDSKKSGTSTDQSSGKILRKLKNPFKKNQSRENQTLSPVDKDKDEDFPSEDIDSAKTTASKYPMGRAKFAFARLMFTQKEDQKTSPLVMELAPMSPEPMSPEPDSPPSSSEEPSDVSLNHDGLPAYPADEGNEKLSFGSGS